MYVSTLAQHPIGSRPREKRIIRRKIRTSNKFLGNIMNDPDKQSIHSVVPCCAAQNVVLIIIVDKLLQ